MSTVALHSNEEAENYQGLRFSFADMAREIKNMSSLAKKFLSIESSEQIIPNWLQALEAVRVRTVERYPWEISKNRPIETIVSIGKYEAGQRQGEHSVIGRISGQWVIDVPPKNKGSKAPADYFVLRGLASTNISIWSVDPDKPGSTSEIARWTVDIGSADHPGCHFHTQIDLDEDSPMFPKSLSVPRLPSPFLTPMDALDFLLSEIFQDVWFKHVSAESDFATNWAACQRRRLVRLLKWQIERLEKLGGSPWTSLKRQKPEPDLFTRK